jgi:diamine N-acetyltransferase
MSIAIRKATKSDYQSLLPLFRQVHEFHVHERPDIYKENSNPVDQMYFESQLDDVNQHIMVATIENDIVGVAVLKEEDIAENSFVNARKVLVVASLCVDESQRKRGIGRRLLQYVFDFGKGLKVDSVELGVIENNTTAIKFYESLGMATKSRRMELLFDHSKEDFL